jgi:hypothetical protein
MADYVRGIATNRPGTPLLRTSEAPRIPLVVFGLSFSLFLLITYVLCVGFDLLFPGQAMYQSWLQLLPGFTWLNWSSFLLGLIESFVYGWYVALIFCPLFNFFASRFR